MSLWQGDLPIPTGSTISTHITTAAINVIKRRVGITVVACGRTRQEMYVSGKGPTVGGGGEEGIVIHIGTVSGKGIR